MTINRVDHIANNTVKIADIVHRNFIHLTFAIWDLSDFLPLFHNVRRNMVFIECEEIARPEAIRVLVNEPTLRNYLIYSGERKPKAINEAWANASSTEEIRDVIVVIGRKDFRETSEHTRDLANKNIRFPFLERRLVDLITYSLRDWLPFSVEEALDALVWYLKKNEVRLSELKRYATRRYIGSFIDVLLYKLEKKGIVSASEMDPRYLAMGERFLRALEKVDNL
ncbi:MAG: hypothetical protein Q7S92_03375 [Candidatus Diapherotrites archaeon]|nr:hypothetical protein [Candidatus Diapherotrites archaeon]